MALRRMWRGEVFGSALRAKGGTPRIVAAGMRDRPGDDTARKLRRWAYAIQRVPSASSTRRPRVRFAWTGLGAEYGLPYPRALTRPAFQERGPP